jgi:uncharacterized protein (TIGR00725 family)
VRGVTAPRAEPVAGGWPSAHYPSMSESYRIHHIERAIYAADGARFDPATRGWTPSHGPARGRAVDAITAVTWLQRESGNPTRLPVAVVGAQPASTTEHASAMALGRALARMGFAIVTGAGGGVAEAVARGATDADGIAIVMTDGDDAAGANEHASLVLATGAGDSQTPILANVGLCMVAVGERVARMPETAAVVRLGKTLVLLDTPDEIDGAIRADVVDDVLREIAACVLRGAGSSGADRPG